MINHQKKESMNVLKIPVSDSEYFSPYLTEIDFQLWDEDIEDESIGLLEMVFYEREIEIFKKGGLTDEYIRELYKNGSCIYKTVCYDGDFADCSVFTFAIEYV